jgi:glycosyltransferase involved in cell wall biosynthesis
LSAAPSVGRIVLTADAVGGVWRYALDAAAELVRRGVAASLLGLGPEPSRAQREEAERAGVAVAWLDARLDWTARDAAEVGASARSLAERVEAEGADLLHLNAPALAGAAEFGVPVVAAAHSCLATWWRAVRRSAPPDAWAWHRRLTARGLRRAAVALAPSRAFAADLVAAYGPLPSLKVVLNGARPIAPQPREAAILAAGRWWDEAKNARVLDRAAARTAWPILAAGAQTGPGGERVEFSHLRPLGGLPPAAMAAQTARAPIFVSVSVYEPFGLAALEAASAGAVLVLSDIPTFRELWEGAALFVDPTDPEDVAAALNGLAADEGLRRRLGGRAARRAAAYGVERQVDGLLAAYATARAAQPLASLGPT